MIEEAFGKSALRLTTRLLRQRPTAIDAPPDRFDDAIELFESLSPLPTNAWGDGSCMDDELQAMVPWLEEERVGLG